MAEINKAVRKGDIEAVEQLVNTNNVNRFYKDVSPLMLACQGENVALVKLLVEKGADVNLQNESGLSPLMKAIGSGHVEVTRVLLECGAKTSLKTREGESALMIACRSGNENTEVIKLLLQQGCAVMDVVISLLVACEAEYIGVVRALLKDSTEPVNVVFNSVKTNMTTKYLGWTALTKASACEHSQVVDILLTNGAGINLTSKDGKSALMVAILNNRQETATLLVERGADLNLPGPNGDTALMLTARTGNIQIAHLLLDRGASIDHQNDIGETCLIAACRQHRPEISKLLIERNANVSLRDDRGISAILCMATHYMYAFSPEEFQVVELLLEKGAEVKSIPDMGESALSLLQRQREYIRSQQLDLPKLAALMRSNQPGMESGTSDEAHINVSAGTSEQTETRAASPFPESDLERDLTGGISEPVPLDNTAPAMNDHMISSPSQPIDSHTASAPAGNLDPPTPASRLSDYPPSERKFNLMFYGVPECREGTHFHERAENDLKNVLGVLEKILPSVSSDSIRDCVRIGEYSPQGTRPLLVRFVRARDVRLILKDLTPDVLPSGITIKCHMSSAEMQTTSILLRERWKLHTQSGVDKSTIKIRGRKLFVDSHQVGEVVDGVYRSTDAS